MDQQWKQDLGKKPYETPRLTTINLRPEEAVLSHCKTATTGTHGVTTCHPFGLCKSGGS